MKAKTLCSTLFVAVVMLTAAPLELSAKTLGMVADNDTDSVTVFDADTHVVLGTVFIAPGDFIGDVLITPDLKRGFVTNLQNQVFVIDLTTSPPSFAGGTNPIPIQNRGVDLSISPDGKFLLVSGGSDTVSISVIDIAAQTEISTFSTGFDTNSVDVCSDGSVLATSFFVSATVRRLTLSAVGTLSDTGEVLSIDDPINVYCAPGAQSGVVMRLQGVTSFTVPGLSVVDTRPLSEFDIGTSGAINLSGNRVFARSRQAVDVFDFNSATGALGASPLLTFFATEPPLFSGADQIALHSNGEKLFVSESSVLNIYNPSTGAFLASITDPNIVAPTGVTVVTEADPCALPPPAGAIVGTNGPNQINGTSGNDVIFGLGGPDTINGRGGNDLICGGAGSDLITGGAGDDVLNTQDGVSGNDSVNGGPGNDTCTGDPGDALSSCNP
jgi:Ca2+-binding RTX toxin-like protein